MSKKNTNIYEAITKLPDELITPEIYQAAIEEANINLFNILPKEYMTDDNINHIIDHAKDHWSYNTFSLSSIPLEAQTQKVCDIAVKKKLENYFLVPVEKRSKDMLAEIVGGLARKIHYLPHVPDSCWTRKLALDGVSSLYHSGDKGRSYNVNSRFYNKKEMTDKTNEMLLIQIFLSYVPDAIKDKDFYFDLFTTSMDVQYIDFLMPEKHKKNDYYIEVAKKNILAVPTDKQNFDTIKAGLSSGKNYIHLFFEEKNKLQDKLFEVMDDEMADIIVKDNPSRFAIIPKKFWKKKRLILAIQHDTDSYRDKRIYHKFDINQFDTDICKAIVLKQFSDCPTFNEAIWTQDFIDFCMESCQRYNWITSMPSHLQTQQMVDTILNSDMGKIQYVRPELISYDIAVKAYAEYESWSKKHQYEKYIPKHYFEDFTMETGLPKDFFSGRSTYNEVRDSHKNYTFCEIGDCYIGFFEDKDGNYTYNRLIMTRRSPMSIKPSIVFSKSVSTFHKTWFEKIIADNDSLFSKPVPGKGLKGKQINPYLDVKLMETVNNIKIYAHSLMGVNVLFTADDGEYEYETPTLAKMKEKLNKEVAQFELAG